MIHLIDREKEIALVEDALDALKHQDRLVETPIVNFFGFSGIGKSRLLDEVVSLCGEKDIDYIKMRADVDLPAFSSEVFQQIQASLPAERKLPSSITESVAILKSFMENASHLVFIVDTIDGSNERQIGSLEKLLNVLVNYSNTFIILASLREVTFPQEKKITRKLSFYPLDLLSEEDSQHYIHALAPYTNSDQQKRIFSWTHGHPLAMSECIRIVGHEHSRLNDNGIVPALSNAIFDALILKKLPANAGKQRQSYPFLLSLFAIPRRFNLIVMRKLIETFAGQEEHMANSVAYIRLPHEISRLTGALQWNRERAGFVLEEPVRTLLFLQLEIVDYDLYQRVNSELARWNLDFSREAEDVEDCVQYEKEYVYHRLVGAETDQKAEAMQEALQKILANTEKDVRHLRRFLRDVREDKELQEALGAELPHFFQRISEFIADALYYEYQAEEHQEQRGSAFDRLFAYLARLPASDEREHLIQDYLRMLKDRSDPTWVQERYERLEANFFQPGSEEY